VPGSLVGGVFSVDQERPVLAIMRRVLHSMLRRRVPEREGLTGQPPSMRRRRAWSSRIDRLLDAASRDQSIWRFPHPDFEAPLLMSTRVVWACRPELLAIKEALQDQRQPISTAALRQLKTFLADTGGSPLFGTDPRVARQAAQQLQRGVTGHPELRAPPQ
jgi:hypothetical protein